MAGSFNLSRPPLHWHDNNTPLAPQWLVKSLLPRTGVALLSGQWSTGKTFMALHLANCVWTGQPFAGQKVKRRGGTLFLAAEAAGDIPIRLRAIQHSAAKINERLPFAWIDAVPKLSDARAVDQLVDLAREADKEMQNNFKTPIALIVVDTMAAAAGFEDKNSAAQAQPVMDALTKLARDTGALVLVVDHFGKAPNAGTRGSNAKESSAAAVLALGVNGSNYIMTVRKIREGIPGRQFGYSLQPVSFGLDEDGDEITTCVVKFKPEKTINQAQRQPKSNGLSQAIDIAILDALRMLPLGPGGTLVKVAPIEDVRQNFYKAYPVKNTEAQRRAFNRQRKEAQDSGLICVQDVNGEELVWNI